MDNKNIVNEKEIMKELEEAVGLEKSILENATFDYVEVNKIEIPIQERDSVDTDDASFQELVASIKKLGLIHPVVVRKNDDDSYTKIAGTRRIKAFEILKKELIPAIIINEKTNYLTELEIAYRENKTRKDLNPLEEIHFLLIALKKYIENLNYDMSFFENKVKSKIENFDELTQKEKDIDIGKAILLVCNNLERKKKLNATEIKLINDWNNFKRKFDLQTPSFLQKVYLSSPGEPFSTLMKKGLVDFNFVRKVLPLKKYKKTYTHFKGKIKELYEKLQKEEIDGKTFKHTADEIVNFYNKNKAIIENKLETGSFNLNNVKRLAEVKSKMSSLNKKANKLFEKHLIEDEKLNELNNKINDALLYVDKLFEEMKNKK